MIVITFDIETTGANLFADDCFAVGYCVGALEATKVTQIESGKWIVDLHKPHETTWKKLWKERGWESRCYDVFWSEHLAMLDKLTQSAEKLATEAELADALNNLLLRLENIGEFSIAFDTVAFDSIWLEYILQKYGFAGLSKKRDGTGYRSGFEIDSYRFGALGIQLGNWSAFYEATTRMPSTMVKRIGAHDPEVDAVNMFIDLADVYVFGHTKV